MGGGTTPAHPALLEHLLCAYRFSGCLPVGLLTARGDLSPRGAIAESSLLLPVRAFSAALAWSMSPWPLSNARIPLLLSSGSPCPVTHFRSHLRQDLSPLLGYLWLQPSALVCPAAFPPEVPLPSPAPQPHASLWNKLHSLVLGLWFYHLIRIQAVASLIKEPRPALEGRRDRLLLKLSLNFCS